MNDMPPVLDRLPPAGTFDPDAILNAFLDVVKGKGLVALGLHFKAMSEGTVSVYTAPIKALVSEKFFSLCADFGPAYVGMMTGDATINRDAPILCCTAEILTNMALREGAERITHV